MGAAVIEVATLSPPGGQIIPSGFQQTARISERTFTVQTYIPKTKRSARPRRILFGALTDPRLHLKRAIPMEITRKRDSVVAYCRDLQEFGCGHAMSDALDDFSKGLSELFAQLTENPDRLGPDMARLREKLCRYLEVRAPR